MKKLIVLMTAAVAVALLAMPGAALAKRGDRNHDRIPDKWEKHFHLSLKVNQANRDPDRDGLKNLQEFKDGTSPRKADSDNDGLEDGQEVETGNNPKDADTDNNGVEDGQENAGTITSFDPQSGMLVIDLGNGNSASGIVNSSTRIECQTAEEQQQENEQEDQPGDVKAAEDGSGDHSGSDNSGPGDDGQGDDNQGDDNNEQANCGTADLTQGTVVHEAELDLENGQATFEKVDLVK